MINIALLIYIPQVNQDFLGKIIIKLLKIYLSKEKKIYAFKNISNNVIILIKNINGYIIKAEPCLCEILKKGELIS